MFVGHLPVILPYLVALSKGLCIMNMSIVMIMSENNENTDVENKGKTKPFKTIPRFYQDLIGSILIMYSNVPESSRFQVARDLYGYVESMLLFTKAIDLKSKGDEKTYRGQLEEAKDMLSEAIALYREGGSVSDSILKLYDAVDILKRIIVLREMIAEEYEIRSNPLSSMNLEEDIQSKNYRAI